MGGEGHATTGDNADRTMCVDHIVRDGAQSNRLGLFQSIDAATAALKGLRTGASWTAKVSNLHPVSAREELRLRLAVAQPRPRDQS